MNDLTFVLGVLLLIGVGLWPIVASRLRVWRMKRRLIKAWNITVKR